MKTIRKTYLENIKSKEWMDKNLKPNQQSRFIREAVADRVAYHKKNKFT